MPSNFIFKEGYDPKKENPSDFFPTPSVVCEKAIKDFLPDYELRRNIRVLDAGAGSGNWGTALRKAWPNVNLIGVDLPDITYANPEPYDSWVEKDYRLLTIDDLGGSMVDIVIGNPPYSTSQGKRDMHLAEKFVEKSFELLNAGGTVLFFLRLNFLSGAYRQRHFWPKYVPSRINVLAERVNFFPDRGNGQTHDHMIVDWYKPLSDEYDFSGNSNIINFWSWR